MTTQELLNALNEAAAQNPDNFEYHSRQIVNRLKAEGSTLDHVDVIFKFMEQHPNLDFGSPGILIFYIEEFSTEDKLSLKLFESIKNSANSFNIWMLIRHTNKCLFALRAIVEDNQATDDVRERASDYLQSLSDSDDDDE